MNQAQRNFIIKKIEDTTQKRQKALEEEKKKYPSLQNWLLHYILSDKFELKSIETIKEAIKKRALSAKQGMNNWMNDDHWSSKNTISLDVNDVIVIPKEYAEEADQVRQQNDEISAKIAEIEAQSNALILRIQLASDKTLQTMINEVDDMGNLSLMDTKLKALTA